MVPQSEVLGEFINGLNHESQACTPPQGWFKADKIAFSLKLPQIVLSMSKQPNTFIIANLKRSRPSSLPPITVVLEWGGVDVNHPDEW